MHFTSLAATALTLLVAINTAQAKKVLSWDAAYVKAEALVGQMSLEQKVDITTGVGWMVGLCVGNTYPVTNPDFPALCLQDAPLGMRFADNVTSGVAGINAAASFDKEGIRARGVYIGQEFYDKGVHVMLGPAMNFARSPEGGRGWEGGGEDPFLNGVLAAETIIGVQSEGVIATAKHYILNDQELNRKNSSSNADKRTLHEVYLWPFARSVEAGVGSIMCAYNQLHGTWACEDDYTQNVVLKGELGFKGFIQSDWSATMSTVGAANGGLDMTMPGDITFESKDSYFGKNLTDAVSNNEVKESRVTDMATRIVAAWYKVGQDKNFPETKINAFHRELAPPVNVQRDHMKLARSLAAASNVLLKNSGVLPLSKKVKSIALVGSGIKVSADGPNGVGACADHGCLDGHLAQGWGSGTADFPYLIDPLTGLTNALGKGVKIATSTSDWDLEAAATAVKGAEVAFVFSATDSGEEYIAIDGNVGDRNNLSLWNNGDALIKAVADANKNTVVVINSVGAVLMPWINHPNIKAVLWPGLAGQESGNALADVVTGAVNPSGRLPYTIAKKEEDYNVKHDPNFEIEYSEKLLVGYKWFDHAKIEPLFPFGHGLSYTSFEYSKLKLNVKNSKKDGTTVKVTVNVKNSGKVDGAEIVQAYISYPKSAASPPKELRGFEKVFLKKGKQEKVEILFTKTELSIWDINTEAWVIPTGKFTIHIGASSRDIRQSASFTL